MQSDNIIEFIDPTQVVAATAYKNTHNGETSWSINITLANHTSPIYLPHRPTYGSLKIVEPLKTEADVRAAIARLGPRLNPTRSPDTDR